MPGSHNGFHCKHRPLSMASPHSLSSLCTHSKLLELKTSHHLRTLLSLKQFILERCGTICFYSLGSYWIHCCDKDSLATRFLWLQRRRKDKRGEATIKVDTLPELLQLSLSPGNSCLLKPKTIRCHPACFPWHDLMISGMLSSPSVSGQAQGCMERSTNEWPVLEFLASWIFLGSSVELGQELLLYLGSLQLPKNWLQDTLCDRNHLKHHHTLLTERLKLEGYFCVFQPMYSIPDTSKWRASTQISPKFPFVEETKLSVIDIQVQEPKASAQSWRWHPQDPMNQTRVCNILSSLPPLALLIKCKFEWIKYTREASKIENNLSPYCCGSVDATAQLHLCPLSIRAVTCLWSDPVQCFTRRLSELTSLQSPQWPERGLNGSLLPFPKQSTPHSAPRGFFSIHSYSVISLSLHPGDHLQRRFWTSSKGKCLHNCCPCWGSSKFLGFWLLSPPKCRGLTPLSQALVGTKDQVLALMESPG